MVLFHLLSPPRTLFLTESCAHLKGLLFLSWPPPERCSGPVSPSEYAYVRTCVRVCVCVFHVAALCHTHMLAFVSLPPRSHEQGLQSTCLHTWGQRLRPVTAPPRARAEITLSCYMNSTCLLQRRSLDNAGEITVIITSVPELSTSLFPTHRYFII